MAKKKRNNTPGTRSIGSVKITTLPASSAPEYNDGDQIEDYLLDLYSGDQLPDEKKIQDILENNFTWPNYYHLSPRRANVVSWFNYENTTSILEIGAGCGAITEELVKHGSQVTAIELSERRATINAHRNRNASNLEIIIGNLEDYHPKQKFDLVVCIGVLEYAGTFINSKTPYVDFLNMLKDKLSDNGSIVLAIENRLGLKYWAGAKEDHTGAYFDSLNQYPSKLRVETFGREELLNLFDTSGLSVDNLYYPFPDYKHPSFIYSDGYHPSAKEQVTFPLHRLPAPVPGQVRHHLFSEGMAMRGLEANELYTSFANSFIVHATRRKA